MSRIEWDLLRDEFPDLRLPPWRDLEDLDRKRLAAWPVSRREDLVARFLERLLVHGEIWIR
jgi:hypothetical protein